MVDIFTTANSCVIQSACSYESYKLFKTYRIYSEHQYHGLSLLQYIVSIIVILLKA